MPVIALAGAFAVLPIHHADAAGDGDGLGLGEDAARLDPHPAKLVAYDLYLGISINGEMTSTLAYFRLAYGRLYMLRSDLQVLAAERFNRFVLPDPAPRGAAPAEVRGGSGDELVALDACAPLTYRYDATTQIVEITAPPEITTTNHLGVRSADSLHAGVAPGAAISYDALYSDAASYRQAGSLAIWNEERLFGAWGVLDNTGTFGFAHGADRYTRLDTSWQYDDVANRVSWRAGDTTSSSLAWTRPVRLAGIQVGRNFGLTPYQVPFPLPSVSGSAAAPSAIDLYINGIHQYTGETSAGAFDVSGIAPITGAGVATVVVRDPLGRAVTTSVPIYVDTRLLVAGLSSFSGEAGTFRRDYGSQLSSYGGGAVASATVRYGLSNTVTVEAHGEGSGSGGVVGAGGLIALGTLGVLNGSVAVSGGGGGGGHGGQFTFGYQGLFPRISLSAQSQRTNSGFRDLAAISGFPAPRATDQATVSVPVTSTATVGVNYVREVRDQQAASRVGSFYCSTQLGRFASLFASGYREFERGGADGIWIGLSVVLGERRSGSLSAGTVGGRTVMNASVSQAADYRGGWESSLFVSRADGVSSGTGRVGYLGRMGEISAAVQQIAGHDSVAVDATGGIAWMDGVLEASRRLTDSFALVAADGVAGLPVLHENRLIGVTDASGHLLVPDLVAYQHNSIGIDTLPLPADARVDASSLDVVPRSRSGVLAHFSVQRYNAVTLRVTTVDGQVLPTGARLYYPEGLRELVVGYDGIVFVEDVSPRTHLLFRSRTGSCSVTLDFKRRAEDERAIVDVGTLTCQPLRRDTGD